MAKRSGNLSIGALIVVVAILIWIPKEVWIAVAVVGAIGAAIYLLQKNNSRPANPKRGKATSNESEKTLAQMMSEQKRFSESVSKRVSKQPTQLPGKSVETEGSSTDLVKTTTADAGRSVTLTIDVAGIAARVLDRGQRGDIALRSAERADFAGDQPGAKSGRVATHGARALQWMPFDTPVRTERVSIGRGGFYVCDGESGFGAAVDTRLPISKRTPDWSGQGIYYFPRYAQLSPQQREAFLGFLHGTRRERHINAGYVWLYIYNLERRALVDPPAEIPLAERLWLVSELTELLENYGKGDQEQNYQALSYGRYLPTLISVARVRLLGPPPYEAPPWPPVRHLDEGALLLGLGRATMESRLSPEWAYQWAYASHPPVSYAPWKVVEEELKTLFVRRYRERHAEGIVLKQPVSSRTLKLEHRFANESTQVCRVDAQVPDVSKLTRPVKPLLDLLLEVMAELEPLRKARRSSTATREAVLAAYPASLVEAQLPDALKDALARLEVHFAGGSLAHVRTEDIYRALGIALPNSQDKRGAARLGHILGLVRIGMEPDPRFEGSTPGSHVVLFRLSSLGATGPSSSYGFALLVAQAGRHLAEASEGQSSAERDTLLNLVRTRFGLAADEAARLEAHIAFVDAYASKVTKLDSRIRALPESDRHALAKALLEIAAADGRVDPAEVRALEKLYKSLQIPPDSLHADLHAVLAGSTSDRVTLRAENAPTSPAVRISEESLARKLEETVRVQAMLHEIFADEESERGHVLAKPSSPPPMAESDATMEGLNPTAARVLRALLSKGAEGWDRVSWDALCEEHAVLPDGTLEAINEWSCEKVGEALLEGDDPLELNDYASTELGLKED